MIKRFIYFVYLKFQLKFLKFKVLKKRFGTYKEDVVSLIESNSHSDLRGKSSISIKNMFYILIVFFALTTGAVFAQTTSTSSTNLNQCAPVNGSGLSVWNSCGFTPSIFQSMSISILGNYTQYQNLLGCNGNQNCINSFHYTGGYGALGDTTALMGYMYTEHPASGIGYFAYLGQKAGFVNNTYAAGTSSINSGPVYGFSFLSPIEHLWAFSRDIAYLLLVIAIIATGLLIIIGGKIGQSQIPITFMSALPNIVAAVILIEFSYALGGFMIDIMNILLVLVFNVFNSGLTGLGKTGFSNAFSNNEYIFHVFGTLPGAINSGLQATSLNKFLPSTGLLSGLLKSLGNFAIHNFSGLIAFLIAIILLFTALKIFILLMKSYIQLLFLPVAAPFMFLFGAFPGQGKMIGKFFMGMAKAVLTFVIVYVVFLLIYYLQHGSGGNPLSFGNGANIPLLGFSHFTSNGGTGVVSVFISIALFVWIPKIVADMTKAFGYDFGAYGTELKKGFSDPYSRLTNWYKRGRGSLSSRGGA